MKLISTFLAGAILMTAACADAQSPSMNNANPGQITVSATGESLRVPDTATVSAGVVTQAATASDAMAANASQMNRTMDALLKACLLYTSPSPRDA